MNITKNILVVAFIACFASAFAQQAPLVQACDQLISDVRADVTNSNVTPQEIQALKAAVDSIASSAHKPDPADLAALTATLKAVKSAGMITPAQKKLLKQEIQTTVMSAGVSPDQATALKQAVFAIYQSSNFSKAEFTQILNDIALILNDLPTRQPKP